MPKTLKPKPQTLPITNAEFKKLLNYVRKNLASKGFDSNAEPEWEMACADGCWEAVLQMQRGAGGPLPLNALAVRLALDRIPAVKFRLYKWRRQDQAAAERGKMNPPTATPIPLLDSEVLAFVAAHGRVRAAKMLAMSTSKLRDLLDEIAYRVRRGAST